ncbi:AAA family ATPase [Chromobacterium haemolyticum]|nr:AAA family ATPase [Chromobacterium haemolyticum]
MPSNEQSKDTAAATLHLVCGKIAAGKSTLTRNLAKQARTVLISEDEWLAQLYPGEIRTMTDYVRRSQSLKQALTAHIAALLRQGLSVVLDMPANTLDSRRWMRELIDRRQRRGASAAPAGRQRRSLQGAAASAQRQGRPPVQRQRGGVRPHHPLLRAAQPAGRLQRSRPQQRGGLNRPLAVSAENAGLPAFFHWQDGRLPAGALPCRAARPSRPASALRTRRCRRRQRGPAVRPAQSALPLAPTTSRPRATGRKPARNRRRKPSRRRRAASPDHGDAMQQGETGNRRQGQPPSRLQGEGQQQAQRDHAGGNAAFQRRRAHAQPAQDAANGQQSHEGQRSLPSGRAAQPPRPQAHRQHGQEVVQPAKRMRQAAGETGDGMTGVSLGQPADQQYGQRGRQGFTQESHFRLLRR